MPVGWSAGGLYVLEYARQFALANAHKSGGEGATLQQVDRYISMYVNNWSIDLGDQGTAAVTRLFQEGAKAGLCEPATVEVV